MTKRKQKDSNEDLTLLGQYLREKIRRRDDIYLFGRKILNSNKITASVEDVINQCWEKYELKPLIIKTETNEDKNRITFIIHLPAHIRYRDFAEKEEHFRDATGHSIEMKQQKGGCVLDIYTKELEMPIPYIWEFNKYKNMVLPLPIGYTLSGKLIVIDLMELPHMLIAGTTLYGKSNLLHVVSNSLLECRDIYMMAFDLKRLDFGYLRDKGVAVITKEEEVEYALFLLLKELDRRIDILEEYGFTKIQTYHNKFGINSMPYVVIIFDELLEIQNQRNSQELLYKLIRLGRAGGFHFILSILRPSHKAFKNLLFTDLRSQLGGRCSFFFREKKDVRMVIDSGSNHYIEPIAGRCLFYYDKLYKLQTMYLPRDDEQKKEKNLSSDFPAATNIPYNRLLNQGGIINESTINQPRKMLPPR